MFSSSQKSNPDFFEGVVTSDPSINLKNSRGTDFSKKTDAGFQYFFKLEGNWTSILKIDDIEVWNYDKLRPATLHLVRNPLPSDCRFRTDLIALLNNDLVKAQEQKDELENLQRHDRKVRLKAKKELKKRRKKAKH